MLLPLFYLVVRSAGASEEAWELLFRARTAWIVGRSVLLVAAVTGASVAIAVPIAWLTVRTDLPLRRTWGVLTALPLVIPSYVGAFLVVSALGPKGLVQQLLERPFGVERLPDISGFPGAVLVLTLLSYPYVLLTVRATLAGLDPAQEEAARSLGHGPLSAAIRVTLRQLRPAIAAGSLLVALYTLSDFGAVSLLRFETFTWAIYQQYQTAFDRSIAAVLSLLLVVLAAGILIAEGYSRGGSGTSAQGPVRRGRIESHGSAGGGGRRRGLCATLAGFALALPIAVLLYWLVRGASAGEPLSLLWTATRNSLYVSVLAAVAAVVLALPVAGLAVRHAGRLSSAIERASFTGYALPGIVVALALVFFGANYAGPVYQTVWLLVFAYVVLFLPAGSRRRCAPRSFR